MPQKTKNPVISRARDGFHGVFDCATMFWQKNRTCQLAVEKAENNSATEDVFFNNPYL